ncbi:hypothetical protein HPB50_016807 [Hyalomma asiaticum]|uniref:Uncharacterized protein n=1 Tax=Hyalomma asiaticum TaxID=266040 RepID=A0ACB7SIK7_HYAAI|nr:hypothetical protein HPB50_016807 [Hyalomma asiaticum]
MSSNDCSNGAPLGQGAPNPATASAAMLNEWDPTAHDGEVPSDECVARVKRELAELEARPLPSAFVAADPKDVTKIHALVVGPPGTPFEGGFFYVLIKCPPNYPITPPRARLMTTDAGRVKFSPNLHENGKMCLSILGTGPGPSWNPAYGVAAVLLTVQSLMTESPYHDEPGYEVQNQSRKLSRYDSIIQHETIRVAVCDQVEACLRGTSSLPKPFWEKLFEGFPKFYDKYEQVVKSQMHLTGSQMNDPYGDWRGTFQYETLLTRLQKLKEEVDKRNEAAAAEATEKQSQSTQMC